MYKWIEIRDRILGPETAKSHFFRWSSGFYNRYMSGEGLDIGYVSNEKNKDEIVPVLPNAYGIDKKTPNYDWRDGTLPFEDCSKDFVFSSHTLEHITDYRKTIKEWYRVLKVGGYMIITVPHRDLYEKRKHISQGSKWNGDHKRFYQSSDLIKEIEESLDINSYRIREFYENDQGYTYDIGPDQHCGGCMECVLVIQKINKPNWELEGE